MSIIINIAKVMFWFFGAFVVFLAISIEMPFKLLGMFLGFIISSPRQKIK